MDEQAKENQSNLSKSDNTNSDSRNKGFNKFVNNSITSYDNENDKDINAQREKNSLKEEDHGHIIECIKCHKHVELDYCPFDEANREIEKKTGFAIEDENHIIYGVCADCRQEK